MSGGLTWQQWAGIFGVIAVTAFGVAVAMCKQWIADEETSGRLARTDRELDLREEQIVAAKRRHPAGKALRAEDQQ